MNLEHRPLFVAVEGVIGSGKTVLAKILAERWDARLILEEVETNPFLPLFYRDQEMYAFQTQMAFLLSRHRQLGTRFIQGDLFHQSTVCDYTFDKDRIFASLTLSEEELPMYETISRSLERDIRGMPDYVIYLQASPEKILSRIRKRGRAIERDMDPEYLSTLIDLYNEHFFRLSSCPVFIVNVDRIDFMKNPNDLDDLIQSIEQFPKGRHYYSPVSLA